MTNWIRKFFAALCALTLLISCAFASGIEQTDIPAVEAEELNPEEIGETPENAGEAEPPAASADEQQTNEEPIDDKPADAAQEPDGTEVVVSEVKALSDEIGQTENLPQETEPAEQESAEEVQPLEAETADQEPAEDTAPASEETNPEPESEPEAEKILNLKEGSPKSIRGMISLENPYIVKASDEYSRTVLFILTVPTEDCASVILNNKPLTLTKAEAEEICYTFTLKLNKDQVTTFSLTTTSETSIPFTLTISRMPKAEETEEEPETENEENEENEENGEEPQEEQEEEPEEQPEETKDEEPVEEPAEEIEEETAENEELAEESEEPVEESTEETEEENEVPAEEHAEEIEEEPAEEEQQEEEPVEELTEEPVEESEEESEELTEEPDEEEKSEEDPVEEPAEDSLEEVAEESEESTRELETNPEETGEETDESIEEPSEELEKVDEEELTVEMDDEPAGEQTDEPEEELEEVPDEEPAGENVEQPTEAPEEEHAEEVEEPTILFTISFNDGEYGIGYVAHFIATLEGFDGLTYTLQWQQNKGDGVWENIEGQTEESMDLLITEENCLYTWRVKAFYDLADK